METVINFVQYTICMAWKAGNVWALISPTALHIGSTLITLDAIERHVFPGISLLLQELGRLQVSAEDYCQFSIPFILLWCICSVSTWIINVSASSWLYDSDWAPLLLEVHPDADTTITLSWVTAVLQSLICQVVRKSSLGYLPLVHYHGNQLRPTVTRKLSYRKDDRAMRPICGCPENFWESLTTPTATATFPEICNGLLFRLSL